MAPSGAPDSEEFAILSTATKCHAYCSHVVVMVVLVFVFQQSRVEHASMLRIYPELIVRQWGYSRPVMPNWSRMWLWKYSHSKRSLSQLYHLKWYTKDSFVHVKLHWVFVFWAASNELWWISDDKDLATDTQSHGDHQFLIASMEGHKLHSISQLKWTMLSWKSCFVL